MACKPVCRLCNNFILSQSISFTDGTLIINIPEGSYANCRKVCVVLSQVIPDTTTINAPVVITIGTGTVQYPVVSKCCRQITACGLRTRTRYSMVVETTATGGVFKMLGQPCCSPNNQLASINGTAPTAPATPATTPTT